MPTFKALTQINQSLGNTVAIPGLAGSSAGSSRVGISDDLSLFLASPMGCTVSNFVLAKGHKVEKKAMVQRLQSCAEAALGRRRRKTGGKMHFWVNGVRVGFILQLRFLNQK